MSGLVTRNLPEPGETMLDHVGHFVADAEEASRALAAAGFTVTPYTAQVVPDPETGELALTGTGNVCVMLRTGYIEVLTHTADTAIGLEFKEALARRAGLHLAAFTVADAEATHADLAAAGWPMRPLARFSRPIPTVDGEEVARFTVARLEKGTMPEGRVQLLTHHDEAALWQERWLAHENTATGLAGVIVSAPDPAEAADRFARLFSRKARPCADGFAVALERGSVEVVSEAAGAALAGRPVDPGRPAFVGYRLAFEEPDRAAALLAARPVGDRLVCAFPDALGVGAIVIDGLPG